LAQTSAAVVLPHNELFSIGAAEALSVPASSTVAAMRAPQAELVQTGRCLDDVSDREFVADDQRDRLRPPQQAPQGAGVSAGR